MRYKLLAIIGLTIICFADFNIALAEELEGHEYDLVVPIKQDEGNIFYVTKKIQNTKWVGYVDGKAAHLFTKAKGMTKVWGMDVAHKNNILYKVLETIPCRTFRYLLELDCENWRIRNNGYAAFSDYFAKGELINSSNEVMEWEYAAPNTGADQMLNFGCALIDKDK